MIRQSTRGWTLSATARLTISLDGSQRKVTFLQQNIFKIQTPNSCFLPHEYRTVPGVNMGRQRICGLVSQMPIGNNRTRWTRPKRHVLWYILMLLPSAPATSSAPQQRSHFVQLLPGQPAAKVVLVAGRSLAQVIVCFRAWTTKNKSCTWIKIIKDLLVWDFSILEKYSKRSPAAKASRLLCSSAAAYARATPSFCTAASTTSQPWKDLYPNWRFPEIGVPPVIVHFNRTFPHKPSILGYPHLLETPKRLIGTPNKPSRMNPTNNQ